MASSCSITGKAPRAGKKYVYRGLEKKKGGNGRNVTGKTNRWFKPNLQKVKVVDENGTVKRVWVSAKAIRSGLITKAPKQSVLAKVRAEEAEFKKRKSKGA